jgi:hypothetical protein
LFVGSLIFAEKYCHTCGIASEAHNDISCNLEVKDFEGFEGVLAVWGASLLERLAAVLLAGLALLLLVYNVSVPCRRQQQQLMAWWAWRLREQQTKEAMMAVLKSIFFVDY